MQVIIDYNNIDPRTRRRGLKYVAQSIAHCLGSVAVGKYRRLHLRFYDGWYQVQTPTQLAQTTAAELQRDFPIIVTVPRQVDNPFGPSWLLRWHIAFIVTRIRIFGTRFDRGVVKPT